MNFKIRKATQNDAKDILTLIHELAVYEKEPDAVKTSVADLVRDGFQEAPYFQSLVADCDGQILGFALYFFTWSTWEGRPSLYLEDLFVSEDARGNQIGLSLFQKLAKIAADNNCFRFEWAVLDWNTLARNFYHSLGAKHMKGWLPYRLEGENLEKIANG